jgi:hypothetical protein
MKCDAEAALSDIALVVWFCSATAPLTFSNTGRIASIACEIRCTASTEPVASFCSASIFLVISSVAFWVCTASALTSEATTAKPRPAAPARAASMVEFSANSVVCLAICAIRLTTLPIAAEDSLRRSTLRLASRAAALAWSASLLASRTWAPILCRMGEFVGGLREGGRGRMRRAGAPGEGVGAPADGGERRRRRLGAAGDRIGRAFELPDHRAEFEFEQFEDFLGGFAFRRAGTASRYGRRSCHGLRHRRAGSGRRLRNKPNAMAPLLKSMKCGRHPRIGA